jgi:hypothetical protein
MSELEHPLTHKGERRRERILQLALAQAQRRKLRRRALRGVAACAASVGIVALVVFIWARDVSLPAPVAEQPVIVQTNLTPSQAPSVEISHIHTDPTILDRLALRVPTRRWQSIGDDELLRGLADAGWSAGLIHVSGRTILLPRHAAHASH